MTPLERYHARRAAGLCCICGEPSGDRCTCKKCRDYTKKRNKIRYYDRADKGLCTKCGKAPAAEGYMVCDKCRKYNKLYLNPQKQKEYYQVRRDKLRAEKMCLICGKNLADPGMASCAECRERRKQMRCRGDAVRMRRAEEGKCCMCERPAWNSYNVCEEHYKILCGNLSKSSRWRGAKQDDDISQQ